MYYLPSGTALTVPCKISDDRSHARTHGLCTHANAYAYVSLAIVLSILYARSMLGYTYLKANMNKMNMLYTFYLFKYIYAFLNCNLLYVATF